MSFRIVYLEFFPQGIIPSSGIAGSYDLFLFFVFLGISILLMAVSVYSPTNSIGRFPLLHILSSIYCFEIFYDGHSDGVR